MAMQDINNMEEVVYIQVNDWTPEDWEEVILDFLYVDDGNEIKDKHDMLVEERICVHQTIYDMSVQSWLTIPLSYAEEHFHDIMRHFSKKPQDYLFKGDRKWFLKHDVENYGFHFFTDETCYDKIKDKLVNLND